MFKRIDHVELLTADPARARQDPRPGRQPHRAAAMDVKSVVLAVSLLLFFSLARADGKRGDEVYEHTCKACHGTKFDKAPQLGDRKAWAPLIKEGQAILTAHAWVGVRNMPPRGGDASLSLEEFARAVAYMARQGGGKWQDPDVAMLARIRAEEKKRLEQLKRGK